MCEEEDLGGWCHLEVGDGLASRACAYQSACKQQVEADRIQNESCLQAGGWEQEDWDGLEREKKL